MKKSIGLWIGVVIIAVLVFVFWQSKTSAPTTQKPIVKQEQATAPSAGQQQPTTGTVAPTTGTKKAGFTVADVATHNNASDCYTIVGDKVYGLTDWINKHPGGADAILSLCGNDGTAAFTRQHGSSGKAQAALASFLVGDLVK